MHTNTPRRLTAMIAATVLVTGGISLVATPASAADDVLDVCSECTYTTIQSAVNAATAGDTVRIAAGTYSEKVTVSKELTIEGAGSGDDPASNTILSGTSGNGLTVTGTAAAPIVVRDLRITGFASGIVTGGHVTLDGVSSSGNASYGISLNNNTTNLTIIDSAFNDNKAGLKLGSQNSANNITVTGSSFDNNTGQGWYSDKNATTGSTLTNVSITDSTFNGNGDKGFYTEKLADATFTRVEFSNSGNERASQGAGLDINLKYGTYDGIALIDVVAIDSGTSATPNGSGISISARNDAPSYSTNPATLTGLSIEGGKVSGSVTGIYLGFNIADEVTITDVDLSGNGLAVNNATSAAVVAAPNWWGSPAPDFASLVLGDVSTSPWYANAAMTVLGTAATPGDPVVTVPADGEIVITVEDGTENPRIDVTELMGEGGAFTVEDGLTVMNSDGASVRFAPGTTVTPSDLWGTEFIALEIVPLSSVTPPGGPAATVSIAIKLGSDDATFTLDRAARILLPGEAGSSVGFIEAGGPLTPITTKCAADTQAAGDAVVRDCYIDVGDDLVVWTKHFTTFLAYSGGGLAATGADSAPLWLFGSSLLILGMLALGLVRLRRHPRAHG